MKQQNQLSFQLAHLHLHSNHYSQARSGFSQQTVSWPSREPHFAINLQKKSFCGLKVTCSTLMACGNFLFWLAKVEYSASRIKGVFPSRATAAWFFASFLCREVVFIYPLTLLIVSTVSLISTHRKLACPSKWIRHNCLYVLTEIDCTVSVLDADLEIDALLLGKSLRYDTDWLMEFCIFNMHAWWFLVNRST